MEDKQLSERDSMLLIRQMIQTAKSEQKDDGRGWIIWGWMLFGASMLTVVNLHTRWFSTYFFWNIFGGLTLIILLYETIARLFFNKQEKVRTYTRDLFEKLNAGFFVSLMFIIVGMNLGISPMIGFPLLLNLYAFWILIYGSALNFRPSIIGAYITWAIGFSGLLVHSFELVMLLHGLGVLCGYIVPGHIANREFKKIHRKEKVMESV